MGFEFQAAAAGGRLRLYRDDGSPESQTFWQQVRLARYSLRSHQQMAFTVEPALSHDFVVSLALTVHAASLAIPRRARLRSPSHSMHEYGR